MKRAWTQGRHSTTREIGVSARGGNSVCGTRWISGGSVGRGLVGSVDTDTDCRRPGTGLRMVVGVPRIGAPRRGAARTNRRNRSPRGGHKDVAQRRAVSDDLSSGLEKPANAGQANGQRERSIRRTASVSWLVEKCHARTIHESHDVPRSSTPLVKIALPRRAVREPSRTLHAASPHRVVAAPPRHSGRAHNTAPCRRSPGSRGI